MKHDPYSSGGPHEEVVFVLRLRARDTGWWGQVRRLDDGSLRYVANQPELHAILDADWLLALPAEAREPTNAPGDTAQHNTGDIDASHAEEQH